MSRDVALQLDLREQMIELQVTKMVRCTVDGCKYADGFHCSLKVVEITDDGRCSGYTKTN